MGSSSIGGTYGGEEEGEEGEDGKDYTHYIYIYIYGTRLKRGIGERGGEIRLKIDIT